MTNPPHRRIVFSINRKNKKLPILIVNIQKYSLKDEKLFPWFHLGRRITRHLIYGCYGPTRGILLTTWKLSFQVSFLFPARMKFIQNEAHASSLWPL